MVMQRRFLLTAERQRLSLAVLFFCALSSSPSFALGISTGPNGSNAQAVHALGYTGQGVSVGLISADYARYTHEAFAGNATWYDATGQNPYSPEPSFFDPQNHDTPLGGIICSRGGTLYPNDKGAAPGAFLYSVKASNGGSISTGYITNALDYLRNQQCKVIVTGFQFSIDAVPPDGSSIWSLIYDYYAYQYNLVFATAAGNYQTSVTVFGDTYNSITTGGLIGTATDLYDKVGSSSNPGPTADGRRKPEVAAPSQNQWCCLPASDTSWGNASPSSGGQTSWGVPHIGGVAAVLLSYADTTTDTTDNQNVVIKAVIVNSTFPNIISKSGTPTTGQLWQNDRGYGRIDALRAYEILSSPKIVPSGSTTNSKGWAYDAVSSGQQDNYIIQGINNERLVITLAWNRRIVWTDAQTKRWQVGYQQINDGELTPYLANLDLEVYDPDGILISPASSTIDNLEKHDLLLAKTGNYQIKVVNQSGIESANYALAFEVLPPLEADFNTDYVVNDLDLVDFVPYWLDTNCDNPLQPCNSYNLSGNNTIDLSDFSAFAQKWLTYDARYYTP